MYNFTKKSRKVLEVYAQSEGRRLSSDSIGPEHILLALMKDDDSVAVRILKNAGVHFDSLRKKVEQSIRNSGIAIILGNIPVNMRYNRIIEMAKEESVKLKNNYIGTEHLLLSIFREGSCAALDGLFNLGIDYNVLRAEIVKILGTQIDVQSVKVAEKSKTSTLDEFSQNLTKLAANNELDPVIGREKEIDRVIRILIRKTKNNPVLIGEAGVGKTALVEGLAQKISNNQVPEPLQDKKVLVLDMAAIIGGTKYRGEFEERIKKIIKEIKNSGKIIIFIDELHTIIGAGAAEGAIDAANILKPALARGDLLCIGATTINEYRMYFEKDAALERRFQTVLMEEPTVDESEKILQGLKERYEIHHKVKYTDESLKKAVYLSDRYIHDRYLPDKAIDVIDEAGSKARLDHCDKPADIVSLEEEIERLNNNKNKLVRDQEYEQAAAVRDLIKDKKGLLSSKINDWQKKINDYEIVVDENQISTIVAHCTGIPVERLKESEIHRLLGMEEELHKRLIGQDDALTIISKTIRRSRTGLKRTNGPVGSFLFLGPTGVGKTELAKALAEFLFDNDNSLIRLDMSEYMEKHSISRLIGAPPGYVGYEEGGQLVEKIKRKPYSVVLFDELEKAHPDIFNILLQILEEGELTDSYGSTVSFRDTIIIMTSNIGSRTFNKMGRMGFSQKEDLSTDEKDKVFDELKTVFSPEFLNRLDDTVYFHKLEKSHIRNIVDLMCAEVNENLKESNIHLKISKSVMNYLSEKGYNEQFGARYLRRTIQKELEDPLATDLLEGKCRGYTHIQVGMRGKTLYFKPIEKGKSKDVGLEKEPVGSI